MRLLSRLTRGLGFYSRIRSNVCKICKIKYGVDVLYGRICMYLPKVVYTSMRNIYLFQLYNSCLPLIQATLSLGLDDVVCKIINNFWTPIQKLFFIFKIILENHYCNYYLLVKQLRSIVDFRKKKLKDIVK